MATNLKPQPTYPADGSASVPTTASAAVKYLSLAGLTRFAINFKEWAKQTFLVKKVTLGNGKDNIGGTDGTLNIQQGTANETTNVGGHLSITAANGVLTFNDTLGTWTYTEGEGGATTVAANGTGGMLLSEDDYKAFKTMAAGGISLQTATATADGLPNVTNPSSKTIYLVPLAGDDKDANDGYAEFIYIGTKWEYLGTTKTDLKGYTKKSDTISGTATGNDLIGITIGGTVSAPTLAINDSALDTELGKKANSATTINTNSGTSELVKVTLGGTIGSPTVSVDDSKLDTALETASDAFKGKTTLTGSENKDLSAGDVTLTLGGDGAAASQTVTLPKITIPAATVKSVAGSGAGYISASAANGEGDNAGKWTVSVSATEVKATDNEKYGSTGLATDGYAQEQAAKALADAKDAVTGGSNTANFITVTTAKTTAAPTVSATLTTSTTAATAIATDKYVEEKIAAAAVAGGNSTSNYVKVAIAATTATPTVTTTIKDATDTAKYASAGLATDAYVREQAAAAEAAAKDAVTGGSGSDAKNLITVSTAATTAVPTVTASLTTSTTAPTAIATDKYVEEKLGTKTTSTATTVWGAIETLEARESVTHTAISDDEIDALF